RRRSLAPRRAEDRDDVAIHERLAAAEVVLADADLARFREPRLDVRERQHLVRVILRRAGDEAMRALDVADRPRDLKPERVESDQRRFSEGHRARSPVARIRFAAGTSARDRTRAS